jgi:hypothetical protein
MINDFHDTWTMLESSYGSQQSGIQAVINAECDKSHPSLTQFLPIIFNISTNTSHVTGHVTKTNRSQTDDQTSGA